MPPGRGFSRGFYLRTKLIICRDHQNFEESTEEIKPLTEEEKKAKLAELRERCGHVPPHVWCIH